MSCAHVDHKGRRCVVVGDHLLHNYGKRIAQRGRKALREMDALDAARAIVRSRNGGACESWSPEACGRDEPHRGAHCHHVFPEDRDAGLHDPERMLFLCEPAHRFAHLHPAAAALIGLLRGERTEAS